LEAREEVAELRGSHHWVARHERLEELSEGHRLGLFALAHEHLGGGSLRLIEERFVNLRCDI